jgi:type 1 glutamine amidotransferase
MAFSERGAAMARRLAFIVSSAAAAFFLASPCLPERPVAPVRGRPIRVLLLSGQNNHDWRSTTPKLVDILTAGERFDVSVTENPGALTPGDLSSRDVIVSNWNAYGLDEKAAGWPENVRRAYLEFARKGGGHLVIHAGGASFPGWNEYGRLALATWKGGQTSHGPVHQFPVRMEAVRHPVTEGLAPFTTRDELWNAPGIDPGVEVLASSFSAPDQGGTGRWEPCVVAGRFGKGRSLAILLGHDAEAMDNPGFRTLFLRAVEWAATGSVAPGQAAASTGPWTWHKEDGSSLALLGTAEPLWEFRYGTDLDIPYFHPLRTTDGRLLTWDRPPDHVWHHGLWFSWKFINAVNYWEIDAKTGQPAGKTSWSNVRIQAGNDFRARIDVDIAYRPAGEVIPVLTEKRMIAITPPDREGAYAIDWTCVFTAAADVVLDRTPLPGEPGGQSWGGYAGLSLRLAEGLTERQAMTSDGPVATWAEDRYRGRHTALDYSGLVEGRPAGIAILDHPANPRSPSPWYVIRSAEMSFFTPAVLCFEPLTLRAGEALVLRYRVLVHPGRWDEARLRWETSRFSDPPPKPAKE